jgi:hypothetical protein
MFGLAKNQLPGAQYSQLNQSIPGLQKREGNNGLKQLEGIGGLLGQTLQTPVSDATNAALANVTNLRELN